MLAPSIREPRPPNDVGCLVEKNDTYVQISVNDQALREIIDAIEDAAKYQIKVGILSNEKHNDDDDDDGIGMADLGAIHEFGSTSQGIPARSFIRLTMFQKRDQFMAGVASNAKTIAKRISKGGIENQMKIWADVWHKYVLECFKSRGFGKWLPLAPSTIAGRKKGKKGKRSDTPLQNSGRLIGAITYEVTKS